MDDYRPASAISCVGDNGEIDPSLYWLYLERQRAEADDWTDQILDSIQSIEAGDHSASSQKRKRSCKKSLIHVRDEFGNYQSLLPKDTYWYMSYVSSPDLDKAKFHTKFRHRFRMPHAEFKKLVDMAKVSGYFVRWNGSDAVGDTASPLELLILDSLRYLGRGWTFDDLEEATAISEETHRQFLHVFITFGSEYLFEHYVKRPTTAADTVTHMHELKQAGFHRCVRSTDATHVVIEKCYHRLRQNHLGGKMPYTARTYNITVNHRRRILSTTSGHPARWNDKTLALYNQFMVGLRDGELMDDVSFSLFERDVESNVIEKKYRGGWLMVDNGYLNWSTTIPPFKRSNSYKEIRWSQWLESLRKDVECTFGIMKGRWRILKSGIRLHGVDACDKIWKTCSALHNMLLEIDGLDEKWEEGVPSDWEGTLGEHGVYDVVVHATPAAIQRLHTREQIRQFDVSGMGVGDNGQDGEGEEVYDPRDRISYSPPTRTDGACVVRELTLNFFRDRLVEHFDILFTTGQLHWPSRTGSKSSTDLGL